MGYQHNSGVKITSNSYAYVREYKKQLLKNITELFNDLDIRFVIANGNLIEYERNNPIYHDDDLDIRFNKDDFDKWENFCKKTYSMLYRYNLTFDDRYNNINQQKINGIQARLIKFNNDNNITELPKMNILCDVVCSCVTNKFWMDYDINFNELRKINLYEVDTYAPSETDSHKVLKKEYGDNYLIPNKKLFFKVGK